MIAATAKLMSNLDLITAAAKIRNITHCNTAIGQQGVLAARVQPNHPSDNVQGIKAALYEGLSYGIGDAVIGINPVIDTADSVKDILTMTKDVMNKFDIPTQNCVLAHVSTQMRAIRQGAPADLIFQSVFAALVTGKFVIAGSDVPGIKRADRRTLQTLTLPPAYEKLFQRHVEAMKELGVEFAEQRRLADRVVSKLKAQLQKDETKPEQPALTALDEAEAVFSGKLLTADWIKSQPELKDTILHVKKGAIVSPLAFDSMRERRITVSYMGKG